MKAFLAAVVVAAVIAVAAYYGLNELGWSSSQVYKSPAVRLD